MNGNMAYIGRPFVPVWDSKAQKVTRYELDKFSPLLIDFSRKQHTFIVAKSGGGKSYLAGVYAEELVRVMENYAVVMLDPMGIFSTLNLSNNNTQELDGWNAQIPGDVVPGPVGRCTIWVPSGDADKFIPGTFDKKFALKAPELSYGTLCYAFDLDPLEPQVNLYRKSQAALSKTNSHYTLGNLIAFVKDQGNGPEMGFQKQTVEALTTKLDALHELGIIASDAPEFSDMVREREVAVFDLSLSSTYTAKILVNFFAEKLLLLRKRITRMVTEAKVRETQIDKPSWYIPPVQFVLDEAHNYLPGNPVLKKCIKEGRNCALMLTAISQSPDLTRDVYANITHLFIGPLVYDDDIQAVRAMLPIDKDLKTFRKDVRSLSSGSFLYYNIDEKIEKCIRVRPRKTLHPASTDLQDERKYFKRNGCSPEPIIFGEDCPKLHDNSFTLITHHGEGYELDQVYAVMLEGGQLGKARVVNKFMKILALIPDDFLLQDTGAKTRAAAIAKLNDHSRTPIREDEELAIMRLKWEEHHEV
jgi:hypothetical protein